MDTESSCPYIYGLLHDIVSLKKSIMSEIAKDVVLHIEISQLPDMADIYLDPRCEK